MKKDTGNGDSLKPVRAGEMYDRLDKAEKSGKLLKTMEEEFCRPLSMSAVWTCRRFFHLLDDDDYEGRYSLISVMALIASLEGDLGEAERYVDMLRKQPDNETDAESMRRRFILMSTELVMPYISGAQFIRTVRSRYPA